MKVVETKRIVATPEEIWAVLEDYGDIARWASNVDHSTLVTEQRDGVGAVRRVQLGPLALLERIVEWRPGSGLAYAVEGVPIVGDLVNAWRLEDFGTATTVTLTSRADLNPILGLVVGRVLARDLRRLLTGLKAHVEASAEKGTN